MGTACIWCSKAKISQHFCATCKIMLITYNVALIKTLGMLPAIEVKSMCYLSMSGMERCAQAHPALQVAAACQPFIDHPAGGRGETCQGLRPS